MMQHEVELEKSNDKKHCARLQCIDHLSKIPKSITQLQKYFSRARPKRGSRKVFTNLLLLHEEKIEDIILDMKDNMEVFNPKIGKERIQHHDVAKLGCLMCLTAKIEISR